MLKSFIIAGIGGFFGSGFRFLLAYYLNNAKSLLPYGTLAANILGSLLFGFLFAFLFKHKEFNELWGLLLITGFCGGFTTFSTFSFENFTYLQNGQYAYFILYTAISIILALLLISLGYWIGKTI